MSQQKKLEQVLDLLLAEDSDQAAELLHQIIVEKARVIYESIVSEEDTEEAEDKEQVEESDEVGGDANKDFTDEIESDKEEIDADEKSEGEAGSDTEDDEEDDEEGDEEPEEIEDRVEDLEDQLAELRAEFDALMGEEMQEPQHADLGDEIADIEQDFGDQDADAEYAGVPGMGGEEQVVGEVVARFESKKDKKLEVAPQAKKTVRGKRADEETAFLTKVADTGQRGTAKLVGTGKNSPLGAEQDNSSFTHIPPRKDYGGKPTKFGSGTGGEYGKYHGDSAKDDTPSDNVDVKPKNSGVKADTTAKYTGGKAAGDGGNKSPLTKKP